MKLADITDKINAGVIDEEISFQLKDTHRVEFIREIRGLLSLLTDVANDYETAGCDALTSDGEGMGTVGVHQMNKVRVALGWEPLEGTEDDGSGMSAEGQHYTRAAEKHDAEDGEDEGNGERHDLGGEG